MPVESSTWTYPEGQQARAITRPTLLVILEKSIETGEFRYARQLALNWLSVYPGDLEVNTWLAVALINDGKSSQGVQILEKVVKIDPEYLRPFKILAEVCENSNPTGLQQALFHMFMLGERVTTSISMPGWAIIFRNARRALQEGNLDTAETYVYQGLALYQDDILGCIVHLETIRALGESANLAKFAELYNNRWPDCVAFKLGLAEARLEAGDELDAVNLLHQCVAADAYGQVCTRWWGENHPYKPLWPDKFEISLDIAIPASVSGKLGWNWLAARSEIPVKLVDRPVEPAPQPKPVEKVEPAPSPLTAVVEPEVDTAKIERKPAMPQDPEWMRKAQKEFSKVAKHVKAPDLSKSEGRYPIYVVLSTKTGLRTQYGEQTQAILDAEMQTLAAAIRGKNGWGAMVFYPDDIETTGKLGMKTTAGIDPWKIKLSLNDLDTSLAKKGGRIGAVLIVGGPDVVPFHSLPNPTDDVDEEVLSDNPYATLDSNYFIPEWPVGRLPGEQGADVGLLLQQNSPNGEISPTVRQDPESLTAHRLLDFAVTVVLAQSQQLCQYGEQQFWLHGFGLAAFVSGDLPPDWRRESPAGFSANRDEENRLQRYHQLTPQLLQLARNGRDGRMVRPA